MKSQKSSQQKEVNQLFEKMRLSATPIDIRQKYMQQALDIMIKNTKMQDLINQPVQSRILQHIFKFGNQTQKDLIFNTLKDTAIQSLNNKYARFICVDIILSNYNNFKQQLLPEVFKFASNSNGNVSITSIFTNIKQNQRDEMINYTLFKEQSENQQFYKQFLSSGQLQVQLLIKNIQFLHLCESKMLLGGFFVTDILLKLFDCILYLNTINQQQSKELLDNLSFLAGVQVDTFMQLLDGSDQTLLMIIVYTMQQAKWKKSLKQNIKGVKKEILQDKISQRIIIPLSLYTDDTVYAQEMMKIFVEDIDLFDSKNIFVQTLYYIHSLARVLDEQDVDVKDKLLWKWPNENIKNIIDISNLVAKVYMKKPLGKRCKEVDKYIIELINKQLQKLPIQSNLEQYVKNLHFVKLISNQLDTDIIKQLFLYQKDQQYIILSKQYISQYKNIFNVLEEKDKQIIKQELQNIKVDEQMQQYIQQISQW